MSLFQNELTSNLDYLSQEDRSAASIAAETAAVLPYFTDHGADSSLVFPNSSNSTSSGPLGTGTNSNGQQQQQLAAAAAAAAAVAASTYSSIYGNNNYASNSLSSTTSPYYDGMASTNTILQQSANNGANGGNLTTTNSQASNSNGGNSQVVTYGGSTFIIQPSATGGSPLITTIDASNQQQTHSDLLAAATSCVTGSSSSTDANVTQQQQKQVSPRIAAQLAAAAAQAVAVASLGVNGKDNGVDAIVPEPITRKTSAPPTKNTSNVSYATRVAPATIQWLISNYETSEGVSLPRSTLYNHYQRHCRETSQDPVNAASFGKLIRSVFLGLRTRRIGTRGNSKYHYYGIRVKPTSPLFQLEDVQLVNQKTQQPVKKRGSQHSQHVQAQLNHFHRLNNLRQSAPQTATTTTATTAATSASTATITSGNATNTNNSQAQSSQPQLKAATVVTPAVHVVANPTHLQHFGPQGHDIDGFPQLEVPDNEIPPNLDREIVHGFSEVYRQHCIIIFDAVSETNFSGVEQIWCDFWAHLSVDNNDEVTEEENIRVNKENNSDSGHDNDDCDDEFVPKRLGDLVKLERIRNFIKEADLAFYQKLVNFLMPDVLKSIPNNLTQSIRNFAKSLESCMLNALKENAAGDLKLIKLEAVKAFSQTLRRYTGLNHLAQAARAVLQNSEQINQMLSDLNRVDFNNVQEQARWICQCDRETVMNLEAEFKKTLQKLSGLESWSKWLESVVEKSLSNAKTKADLPSTARQFLLRWSFYSSMVIRDLTLRSAASFGSFHLIRLLFDEYMFYLVELRVASALGKNPVSVSMTLERPDSPSSPVALIEDEDELIDEEVDDDEEGEEEGEDDDDELNKLLMVVTSPEKVTNC